MIRSEFAAAIRHWHPTCLLGKVVPSERRRGGRTCRDELVDGRGGSWTLSQGRQEHIAMKTDSQVQRDVMTELQWEPTLHAAEIGVAVKDGVVTLSGHVDSYTKGWAAERAANRVSGVKAVAEEITVKLPDPYRRADADIARSATNVLERHFLVPHDRVKATVQGGRITLSGDVDWYYQKRMRRLPSVT